MSFQEFLRTNTAKSPTDISPASEIGTASRYLQGGSPLATRKRVPNQAAAEAFAQHWWPNYTGGWNTLPAGLQNEALEATMDEMDDFSNPNVINLDAFRNTPVPGAVDTQSIYDTALSRGNRQFQEYLLPQLIEKFGTKGLRYSTDLGRAASRSYGDLTAQILEQAAQADVTAREAAAGRVMTGREQELGAQRLTLEQANAAEAARRGSATGLSNIGAIINALNESNLQRNYQEFLRFQPDAYYGAAQSFLGTRPISPNLITGGQPIFTQQPSQLDAVNEYLRAIANISGTVGSFLS